MNRNIFIAEIPGSSSCKTSSSDKRLPSTTTTYCRCNMLSYFLYILLQLLYYCMYYAVVCWMSGRHGNG